MNTAKRNAQRLLRLTLVFAMLLGLMVAGSSAAASTPNSPPVASSTVELNFVYPSDVPQSAVKLTVFKGIPQWDQKNEAKTVEDVPAALTNPTDKNYPKLVELKPNAQGKYIADAAGGYCYFVRGKEPGKYYNIIKLFIVTKEDLLSGTKSVPVKTGPSAGTGFETGNNAPVGSKGEKAPADFNQGVQHLVPIEGTDEMAHLLGTDGLVGYKPFTTPAFQPGRAMYQATTQSELMDFIAKYAKSSTYMHVYSAGKTENLAYDYPVLVFTKKNIPSGATMEEAAQILKDGGLPIVWQQAQIHPYEPAAGESALVMIQELCGAYGKNILDSIDIVMIPRINVEGGFLFWRGDYNGVDMNRDHMAIASQQTALLHETYYKFMPHVVIDNHEFFFSEMGSYNNNAEQFKLNDFQITGASSLNDDPAVTALTTNVVVDQMHRDLLDTGFRAFHYGITSNNPIGRAYYGLNNSISVLIESHGADGALFAFPRRVYGQVVATKSVFDTTAKNAARIVSTIQNARADVAKKGAIYDTNDVLVLKQSASGAVKSPTALHEYVADIYGKIETIGAEAIDLQDTIVRSRPRPTAYVVDASAPKIDELLYILDHHDAEYFRLKAGTAVELQQYYYISKDGTKSCIADLRDSANVKFANGAILIPMDQTVGNIIGMLMEPDVGDSARYNGTLYQSGLITYDKTTNNFPLYRYTGDNPRTVLAQSFAGNFTDVKQGSWYYDAVRYACEKGLFTGTSSTTFSPDRPMTRAMLATVLYSMEGSPAVSGTLAFPDLASGDWCYSAVLWASQKGLVSGYSNGKFGPNDVVTREQMALILYQYAAAKGYTLSASGSLSGFSDRAQLSSWAEKSVQWAVGAQLLSGKGSGLLDPAGNATRAEVAQILMRFSTLRSK